VALIVNPEFLCRVCKTGECLIAPGGGTGICPSCCEESEEGGHDFSERFNGWLWCIYCGQPASDEYMAGWAQVST
jgi:hypothetical protein